MSAPATGEEAVVQVAMMMLVGTVTFTTGAAGFASQIPRLIGAQVDDSLLVALAVLALTTGTAIFAFTFKLLLQVKDNQTRMEGQVSELEKDVNRLENDK